MAEQTPEERRAALIERIATIIATWDDGSTSADAAQWDTPAAWRGEAGAILDVLAAEGRLIEPGDLQGSVAIAIDQLRVARADLARYRAVIGNACELLDEDWPASAAEFRRVAGLLPP